MSKMKSSERKLINKLVKDIFTSTKLEMNYNKNKFLERKDPILQRLDIYEPEKPKKRELINQYLQSIQPKPDKKSNKHYHQKSSIFSTNELSKIENDNAVHKLIPRFKLRNESEIKSKIIKPNNIRTYKRKDDQMKKVLDYSYDAAIQVNGNKNQLNNNAVTEYNKIILKKQNIVPTYNKVNPICSNYSNYRNQSNFIRKPICINKVNPKVNNTFDRIFSTGDSSYIKEQNKYQYKSTKFKKAKKDSVNELFLSSFQETHQKENAIKNNNNINNFNRKILCRNKSNFDVSIKPNQVKYSFITSENKKNCLKRLLCDEYQ